MRNCRLTAKVNDMNIDFSRMQTAIERDQADLVSRRAAMVCSRLQGRLTLGPAICSTLDAMANAEDTPWAMRETILYAGQWQRTSQTIDELAWLLGFDDDQMDRLFETAMTVTV